MGDMEGASKDQLLAAMQDPDDGADRIRVHDDDGTDLGTVGITRGRWQPRVSDELALLAWVKAGYPHEVTEKIRPAFLSKILGWVKDYKEPITPTGEVIPGVEISPGKDFLTVRATDAAAERARIALGASLPELTAGE